MKKSIVQVFCALCMLLIGCSNSEATVPIEEPLVTQDPKQENTDVEPLSAVDTHGQLQVSGKHLVDKNGTVIQLRGMSLSWSQWWPQFYTPEVVKWLKDDFQVNIAWASMGIEDRGGYLEIKAGEKAKNFRVIDADF